MAYTVPLDSNVLFGNSVRDLVIRIARSGLVRARWTEQILDECFQSLAERYPDIKSGTLERLRCLICEAVPDCLVSNYEQIEHTIVLPDPSDRHVVAAAIRVGAQAIVTFNVKDFPEDVLSPYDIEVIHPDDFVINQIDLDPQKVVSIVQQQAAALRNPRKQATDILDALAKGGLSLSAQRLREIVDRE